MKRLFWLGVGVAVGVAITRKASSTVQKVTPAGIAENLSTAVGELAGAIGAFGADVRAGMSERAAELTKIVEQKTGVVTGAGGAERHVAEPERAR